MPERGLDSGFWGDKWIRKLEPHARYLFLYLWSNDHCNPAAVYEITLETMSFETGLAESDLPELLEGMKEKVKWLPDEDLIWVKNFIKRQSKSSKFLIAVAKSLQKINNNGLVAEVVEYNYTRHSISIPYPYTTDSISISPVSVPVSSSRSDSEKGDEVVKGKGETEVAPKGAGDSHRAEGDEAITAIWRSVKGWRLTPDEELELVARLRAEFPELDLLAESKTWAARKLSEPLKANSKPSQQIWNWMVKGRQFAQERRQHGQREGERVTGSRPASDFRGKW